MLELKLTQPLDGSTTNPLQQQSWPAAPLPQADPETPPEDRGLPRAVTFTWDPPPDETGPLRYDLHISSHPDLAPPLILEDLSEPRAEVAHLFIATPYAWKVIARRGNTPIAESPVWRFVTHSDTPRWINVSGITNVRDLGGWALPGKCRVRQGMVYRSGQLNGGREITPEGREVLMHHLGIRTDLDIRWSDQEPTQPVLDEEQVRWINIPILGYGRIGEEQDLENYPRVFELFAQRSSYPILFHCAAGADRAGTIAFILKALLGVSTEDLFRDYELTSLSGSGVRDVASESFQGLLDALQPFGKNYMERAESYLLSTGVTPEEIAAIRELLIVDCQDR